MVAPLTLNSYFVVLLFTFYKVYNNLYVCMDCMLTFFNNTINSCYLVIIIIMMTLRHYEDGIYARNNYVCVCVMCMCVLCVCVCCVCVMCVRLCVLCVLCVCREP
jgi:hypothetical protein